jgi:thioredoxin-related protein
MKKLVIVLLVAFAFSTACSTLKISGEFKMQDGSSYKFDNAKIKINNKKAIIKTKVGETEVDMKKVSTIDIDIQ